MLSCSKSGLICVEKARRAPPFANPDLATIASDIETNVAVPVAVLAYKSQRI